MELIDKAAVVAEIERRIESCAKQREDMLNVQCHALADDASTRMGELNCIKDFLDTLEVKDVDLDRELDFWRHNHFHGRRDKEANGEYLERVSQLALAKHFFKLGLKAQKVE